MIECYRLRGRNQKLLAPRTPRPWRVRLLRKALSYIRIGKRGSVLTERMKALAISPSKRELTRRLIASESEDMGTEAGSAFRACEKLRRPLSMLLGTLGYRALIMRALTLAKRESSSLESVTVKDDGSLDGIDAEAEAVGSVLTEHLLGLLLSFVGEAVTLRLLDDVWPDLRSRNTTLGETE